MMKTRKPPKKKSIKKPAKKSMEDVLFASLESLESLHRRVDKILEMISQLERKETERHYHHHYPAPPVVYPNTSPNTNPYTPCYGPATICGAHNAGGNCTSYL